MFLCVNIADINVKGFYFTEHILSITDFLLRVMAYFVQDLGFGALTIYYSHASNRASSSFLTLFFDHGQ